MKYEDVECICLAQGGVLCHSFMSTIMNFFGHKNQICGSDNGDSEGSLRLKCDAMWSGKCVLRGRQQVSQKHIILLLIKRYNQYKFLACSTTFFQLSLFSTTLFQLRTFMLLYLPKRHLPSVF